MPGYTYRAMGPDGKEKKGSVTATTPEQAASKLKADGLIVMKIEPESALSKEQLLALRDAAGKHLARFVTQIRAEFPNLTDSDMDYCYLFLLGLNEADISALMQRAYTTVCDRSRKISRIIGASDSLYQTLRNRLSER